MINGQEMEIRVESEQYFLDADDPSRRLRIVEGDIYDDRTGARLATRDMYDKAPRSGYLMDKHHRGSFLLRGINNAVLPRRVINLNEQFVYAKDNTGKVMRLSLTKDGLLLDRGKVFAKVRDIDPGKTKTFYDEYRLNEDEVLVRTDKGPMELASNETGDPLVYYDGRRFELDTFHSAGEELFDEFTYKLDPDGYLIVDGLEKGEDGRQYVKRGNKATQIWRAAEAGQWKVDERSGDAIRNDGLILGRKGTWKRDRDDNLYIGGITQDETDMCIEEGNFVDTDELNIGKTGREETYFISQSTYKALLLDKSTYQKKLSRFAKAIYDADGNLLGYIVNHADGFRINAGRLVHYEKTGKNVIENEDNILHDFGDSFGDTVQNNVIVEPATGNLVESEVLAKHDTFAVYTDGTYRRREIIARFEDVYFNAAGDAIMKEGNMPVADAGDFVLELGIQGLLFQPAGNGQHLAQGLADEQRQGPGVHDAGIYSKVEGLGAVYSKHNTKWIPYIK